MPGSIIWEHGGDIILGTRKGGGLSVGVELPIGAILSSPDRKDVRLAEEVPTPNAVAQNS
jgi:hypothetical protein